MLLECAMGKYPYDASGGPLVLMMQVSSNICQACTSLHTPCFRLLFIASLQNIQSVCQAISLTQVLNEPVPLPGESECSEEFIDFVGQCLRKDPFQRPDAETLLSHPFVAKVGRISTSAVVFDVALFSNGRSLTHDLDASPPGASQLSSAI